MLDAHAAQETNIILRLEHKHFRLGVTLVPSLLGLDIIVKASSTVQQERNFNNLFCALSAATV